MKEPGQHFKNRCCRLSCPWAARSKLSGYALHHRVGVRKPQGGNLNVSDSLLDADSSWQCDVGGEERESFECREPKVWFAGSSRRGRAGLKRLAELLPPAHCTPARGGNHCCASSLSLTTNVNKDLNNKQRNASLCVTVSFTGPRPGPAMSTLITLSKGACNGWLISFLWRH